MLLYVYVNVNQDVVGPDWLAPTHAGWGCTREGELGGGAQVPRGPLGTLGPKPGRCGAYGGLKSPRGSAYHKEILLR